MKIRVTAKDLTKTLCKMGFSRVHCNAGDHIKLRHDDGRWTQYPHRGNKTLAPGTVHSALKMAQVDRREFYNA